METQIYSSPQKKKLLSHTMSNLLPFLKYYKIPIAIVVVLLVLIIPHFVFATQDFPGASATFNIVCNEIQGMFDISTGDTVRNMVSVQFSDNTLSVGGITVSTGDVITQINGIAQVLAKIILVITFCVSFVNMPSTSDYTFVIKRFMALTIGMLLISMSMSICMGISDLGVQVINLISGDGTDISSSVSGAIDQVEQTLYDTTQAPYIHEDGNSFTNIWDSIQRLTSPLSYMFQLALPWLISRVAYITIYMTCWARAVEIIILAAFSPMSFGDIMNNQIGGNSGTRFIKNFGSLALSGAIILIISRICGLIVLGIISSSLDGSSTESFLSSSLTIVGITLAQAGLIAKSQTIAKTIVGIG